MYKWLFVLSATLTIGAVAAFADGRITREKPIVVDRDYVLPHAKAEILGVLLKLDAPSGLRVTTERGKIGLSTLRIAAAETTHSIIAPFVKLLDEERLASEARQEEIARRIVGDEYYDTHVKPFKDLK